MNPRLHPKGHSFMGVAAYVLHDKDRATTSDRVGFTETRNLATDDPHVAARVMAADAMDRERRKDEAGVKRTGQKSTKSVLHLSISWHPDQNPSREEKTQAADGALKALGAQKHQAIIVEHLDEPQAHLHLIVNRADPKTGKMLSSSKEKIRLSEWAEALERNSPDGIQCPQRVTNNEARRRGEFTRASGWVSREEHEARNAAANDNRDPEKEKKRLADKKRRADLSQDGRDMASRHAQGFSELLGAHKAREKEIRKSARRGRTMQIDAVRAGYKDHRTYLFHEKQAESRAFDRDEATARGRVQNRRKEYDARRAIGQGRARATAGVFNPRASEADRKHRVMAPHRKREAELNAAQRKQERAAARSVAAERTRLIEENRARYVAERSSLILTQKLERAALQSRWKTINDERTKERRAQKVEADRTKAQTQDQDKGERDQTGASSGGRSAAPAPKKAPEMRQEFDRAAGPEPEDDRSDEEARDRRLKELVAKQRQAKNIEKKKGREPGKDRDIGD